MIIKTRAGWEGGELNQRLLPTWPALLICPLPRCSPSLSVCQKPGLLVFFVPLESQPYVCSFICAQSPFSLGESGRGGLTRAAWQEALWVLIRLSCPWLCQASLGRMADLRALYSKLESKSQRNKWCVIRVSPCNTIAQVLCCKGRDIQNMSRWSGVSEETEETAQSTPHTQVSHTAVCFFHPESLGNLKRLWLLSHNYRTTAGWHNCVCRCGWSAVVRKCNEGWNQTQQLPGLAGARQTTGLGHRLKCIVCYVYVCRIFTSNIKLQLHAISSCNSWQTQDIFHKYTHIPLGSYKVCNVHGVAKSDKIWLTKVLWGWGWGDWVLKTCNCCYWMQEIAEFSLHHTRALRNTYTLAACDELYVSLWIHVRAAL